MARPSFAHLQTGSARSRPTSSTVKASSLSALLAEHSKSLCVIVSTRTSHKAQVVSSTRYLKTSSLYLVQIPWTKKLITVPLSSAVKGFLPRKGFLAW